MPQKCNLSTKSPQKKVRRPDSGCHGVLKPKLKTDVTHVLQTLVNFSSDKFHLYREKVCVIAHCKKPLTTRTR